MNCWATPLHQRFEIVPKRLADRVDDEGARRSDETSSAVRAVNAPAKRDQLREHGHRLASPGEDDVVGDVFPDHAGEQLAWHGENKQNNAQRNDRPLRAQHQKQAAKNPAAMIDWSDRLGHRADCMRCSRRGSGT